MPKGLFFAETILFPFKQTYHYCIMMKIVRKGKPIERWGRKTTGAYVYDGASQLPNTKLPPVRFDKVKLPSVRGFRRIRRTSASALIGH